MMKIAYRFFLVVLSILCLFSSLVISTSAASYYHDACNTTTSSITNYSPDGSYHYVNYWCDECESMWSTVTPHSYVNGVCVCGVKSTSDNSSIETSAVINDLKTFYEVPEAEFPANNADTGIYLIHFVEAGYTQFEGVEASTYGLYFYLYNPSGKDVAGDLSNVQMGCLWTSDGKGNYNPQEYIKYDLAFVNSNANKTLLKYRVKDPDDFICFVRNNTRQYDISGIELAHTDYDVKDYKVGYSYIFKGYAKGAAFESVDESTLMCTRKSLTTITVEAHQVSYLTGNSDKGAGYSNQINSVYFSIPKDIVENYGELYEIKYEYNHFYTAPIIVTNNQASYERLLADVGKKVDGSWEYKLFNYNSLSGDNSIFQVVNHYYNFLYGDLKKTNNAFNNYFYYRYVPYITTVFKYDGEWDTGTVLYSAEDLNAYFQNYNSSYHTGKKFGYSADLFDLNNSSGYQVVTKNINDSFDLHGSNDNLNIFQQFGEWISGIKDDDYDINDVKYIEKIDSIQIFNDFGFSKNYLVSDLYKEKFKEDYIYATANSEYVYLLRYAFADNYYSLDLTGSGIDGDFIMNQGNVYLNFDFIHFGFGDSENLTIIPVVSDPTKGYFDAVDTTQDKVTLDDVKTWFDGFDNPFDDLLAKFKKIIGIILIVAVCLAAVWLILKFAKPLGELIGNVGSREKKTKNKKRGKK